MVMNLAIFNIIINESDLQWLHPQSLQNQSPWSSQPATVYRHTLSTDSIARGLQKAWPYCPSALLVTINSPGGSINQARTIADLLKLYSNRYKFECNKIASPLSHSLKINASIALI